jgi:hypothetical protein
MSAGEFVWGFIGAGAIWYIIGVALYGFWCGLTGK